jgi:hypothetical protein
MQKAGGRIPKQKYHGMDSKKTKVEPCGEESICVPPKDTYHIIEL